MKKLALLLLLSVAVYGADSANSKESNSGYDKCVEILKEVVPPLYVNVALYNVLPLPERAKPYCTALGLYLNLLVESPKPKAKK
ncbi:hypothetical protein ACWIUD_07670 [Helicobacter sp. 23-1044]